MGWGHGLGLEETTFGLQVPSQSAASQPGSVLALCFLTLVMRGGESFESPNLSLASPSPVSWVWGTRVQPAAGRRVPGAAAAGGHWSLRDSWWGEGSVSSPGVGGLEQLQSVLGGQGDGQGLSINWAWPPGHWVCGQAGRTFSPHSSPRGINNTPRGQAQSAAAGRPHRSASAHGAGPAGRCWSGGGGGEWPGGPPGLKEPAWAFGVDPPSAQSLERDGDGSGGASTLSLGGGTTAGNQWEDSLALTLLGLGAQGTHVLQVGGLPGSHPLSVLSVPRALCTALGCTLQQ